MRVMGGAYNEGKAAMEEVSKVEIHSLTVLFDHCLNFVRL